MSYRRSPILFLVASRTRRFRPGPHDGAHRGGDATVPPPPRELGVSESSGASSFSIPIAVPPGTGGFAPALSLAYSSRSGDSPFGVGWRLPLPSISRSTRFGSPDFLPSDTFELSGELLVPSQNPSEAGRYHTTTETFQRIRKLGDRWEVTASNGEIARFGLDATSRVLRDGASGPTLRWLLAEREDVHGNVIRYVYAKTSPDIHTPYLSRIEYSLRGGVPVGDLREVRFAYETRPDPVTAYRAGARLEIAKRVREIQVTVGGAVFARLALRYLDQVAGAPAMATGRSRLASAQLFGTDCPLSIADPTAMVGGCSGLPRQAFTYTDASDVLYGTESHWSTDITSFSIPFTPDAGFRLADVNGDGLPDYLRAASAPTEIHEVYLNNGSGWDATPDPEWSARLAAIRFTDKQENLSRRDDNHEVCGRQIVDRLDTPVLFDQGSEAVSVGVDQVVAPQKPILTDIDGDGLVDIVISYGVGEGVSQWNCTDPWWDTSICVPLAGGRCEPVPPLLLHNEYHGVGGSVREVWLNSGDPATGWVRSDSLSGTLPPLAAMGLGLYESFEPIVAELTGDSVADWIAAKREVSTTGPSAVYGRVVSRASGAWVSAVDGTGSRVWQDRPDLVPPFPHFPPEGFSNPGLYKTVRFADVNGDGLTDLVKTPVGSSENCDTQALPVVPSDLQARDLEKVWLSTGSGWCSEDGGCTEATRYRSPISLANLRNVLTVTGNFECTIADAEIRFLDLNGDALPDLVRTDGSGVSSGGFAAWLNDPAGSASTWALDERFKPPTSMSTQAKITFSIPSGFFEAFVKRPVGFVDLDGSGSVDLFKFVTAGGSETPVVETEHGVARFADLLSEIDQGGGGRLELAYASATKAAAPQLEATAAADAEAMAEDDGTPKAVKGAVVSLTRITGTQGISQQTTYAYARHRWCPTHRASLGFRGVTVTRSDGARVDSLFYQAHGRTGRLSSREIWKSNQRLRRIERHWQVVDGATVGGSAPGVFVGRVVGSRSWNDYASGPGADTTTAFEIDDVYGFNFASRVTVTRPTSVTVNQRTPHTADPLRWISGLIANAQITDSTGSTLIADVTSEYDVNGRLHTATRVVRPRTTAQLDPPAATTLDYDAYGNLTHTVDAEGRETYLCYDGDTALGPEACPASVTNSHSVLVGVRDPMGGIRELFPDPVTGQTLEEFDFNGNLVRSEFDAFGRVTAVFATPVETGVEVRRARFVFHDLPDATRGFTAVEAFRDVGDGNGTEVRSASYSDGAGFFSMVVNETPSGYVGVVEREHSDPVSHTRRTTQPVACADAACAGLIGYEPAAAIVNTDALGRTLWVVTPDGTSRFGYFSATSNHGIPEYANQRFDVVVSVDGEGVQTRRWLDAGRLAIVEECTDRVPVATPPETATCTAPAVTAYRYDAGGALTEILDAEALASGDLTSPRHVTRRSYDTLGRVIEIRDPNAGTSLLTYDRVGNVKTSTNARGQTTSFQYDALDRLFFVDRPVGELDVTITFDPATHLRATEAEVDATGSIQGYSATFDYDEWGRLSRRTQTVDSTTLVMDFAFDLLDRPTLVRYPVGGREARYEYAGAFLTGVCDSLGACTTASVTDQFVTGVQYDGLGRFERLESPAGAIVRGYSPATQRLDSIGFEGANAIPLLDLQYQFDRTGAVEHISDLTNGLYPPEVDASATYDYDTRGRLAWSTRQGSTLYFNYNDLGNLIGYGVSTPLGVNQHYDDPEKPHAIKSSDKLGIGFDYDPDGNVIRRGAKHYTYDSAGRLTCVGTTSGACDLASFDYDLAGTLLRSTVDGATTYRFGDWFEWRPGTALPGTAHIFTLGQRIATRSTNQASLRPASQWAVLPVDFSVPPQAGALAALYLGLLALVAGSGGLPQVRRRPLRAALASVVVVQLAIPPLAWGKNHGGGQVVTRWIVADRLGSDVLSVDGTGTVTLRRTFGAFGALEGEWGTEVGSNAQRFTGQELFGGSVGLHYFHARWYDAGVGRFASPDPLLGSPADPQSMNAYSYVQNDPLNLVDPTGLAGADREVIVVRGSRPPDFGFRDFLDFRDISSGIADSHIARLVRLRQVEQLRALLLDSSLSKTMGSGNGSDARGTGEAGEEHREVIIVTSQRVPAGELGPNVCPGACHFGQGFHPFRQSSPGLDEAADVVGPFLPLIPIGLTVAPALLAAPTAAELLVPGGALIGAAGSRPSIRVVQGGLQQARSLFNALSRGGKVVQRTASRTLVELQGGGTVQLRTVMTRSPKTAATIDVKIPGVPITGIKFNP